MGGNTKQQAQRRQAKASAKAKGREGKHMASRKKAPPITRAPNLNAIQVGPDVFSDADMAFWIQHGINYTVSNMAEGTWTPMFPDIYEGGGDPMPLDTITQMVMDKYNDKTKGDGPDHWPVEGKAALAWAVQDRKIVYVYYREAQRRLLAAHGGDADIEAMCRAPHNPLVWALFDYMKDKILNRNHG